MTVSSRTPEGFQGRCPLCRRFVVVTPSDWLKDAPCPACGVLIWPIQGQRRAFFLIADKIQTALRRKVYEAIQSARSGDSLALVETLITFEEFDALNIPDELAKSFRTVDDFLEWLEGELDGKG